MQNDTIYKQHRRQQNKTMQTGNIQTKKKLSLCVRVVKKTITWGERGDIYKHFSKHNNFM